MTTKTKRDLFFEYIINKAHKPVAPTMPTMHTDGKTIEFDIKMFEWSQEHEGIHAEMAIQLTIQRLKESVGTQFGDPEKWNLATDIVINKMLEEQGIL